MFKMSIVHAAGPQRATVGQLVMILYNCPATNVMSENTDNLNTVAPLPWETVAAHICGHRQWIYIPKIRPW